MTTRTNVWIAAAAAACCLAGAGAALAVAESEPATEAAEIAEAPPVGTEPAPRVMPTSREELPPQVERKSMPEPGAAASSEAAPTGSVARSAFTREVLEREPQGEVTALENDATQILYFTELRGLDGEHVTHHWEFNGESMADVGFEVRGDRWRVYSSKKLDPSWLGTWTVVVLDSSGNELSRETFDYVEVGEAPGDAAPAAMAP